VSSGDLSIVSYAPVIRQSVDSFQERLQTEKETYTITDGIGFDTASFILTGPPEYLAEWFENGLVRDVTWKAPDGRVCWQGYVNRLALTIGDVTRTVSVDGMANRVFYVYTPLDTTQNPPTASEQTTITKNDATSQARYGIKTAIVSGNETTAATADDEAYSALKRLKLIRVGEQRAIGQGKYPSLTVQMRGYAYMVDWCLYEQTGDTGTDNAHTIIIAVLTADANGIIYASDVNIDTNTTAIEKYHDGKSTAWKIIQNIAARGRESGSEGWPWTCGVYEGRKVWYKAQEGIDGYGNPESTNKYLAITHHISDQGDVYLDEAGAEIPSWAMRPDRLVYTSGIPGLPMLVKKVKWDAPGKVTLTGEDARNPLRQRSSRETNDAVVEQMRSWFYAKDRDVTIASDREIVYTGIIPVGGIILWSGAIVDIPTGWQICDGTNGTPNLQDRFVVGAGDSYAVGATGGAASNYLSHTHTSGTYATDSDAHTHGPGTLNTDDDTHNHDVIGTSGTSSASYFLAAPGGNAVPDTMHVHGSGSFAADNDTHDHDVDSGVTASDSHSHDVTGSSASAGSAAQENRPPYYALAYIQRLS